MIHKAKSDLKRKHYSYYDKFVQSLTEKKLHCVSIPFFSPLLFTLPGSSWFLLLAPPPTPPPGRPSPVVVLRRAAGLEAVGDVPVGEELQDPLGQWQRLDLVGRDGVAQDGAAQVGQAGHLDGGPPEPDVTIPGSATRRHELLVK